MEIQNVSIASIMGMVISLIISVGLPIALVIVWKKKTKSSLKSFFIGAGTFVVAALVLESIFHSIVFKITGDAIIGNMIIYGIYGGLAAGVFEETGRLVAMKLFMKKTCDKENAIMYGIGHGGIEAIIIVGLTEVSNILTSIMINTGALELTLKQLPDDMVTTVVQQLSALWTTEAYAFYLGGIERISAIILHICLSYMVYLAVKNIKYIIFVLAIAIHMLVDAGTVILVNVCGMNMIVFEVVLLAVMIALAAIIAKKYREEN